MQHEDITRADICLSPALAIGEGWYGLEQAADDGRSLRWSSARSCLRVDLDRGALPEDGSVVLHLGSPAGNAHRQIVMRGPRGSTHHVIRSGWDYYAFPLRQIIGELRAPSVSIWVEVSEPFHAPGDSRDLGVMVDQIMLEDDGRSLPFILVDGLVASVKKHQVNQVELKICDYAQSTAPDLIVGELRGDEYQLGSIGFRPGDVVIDIGGHIGIFSCYLAKKYPFLKILAFEPIPVSYQMFRRNLTLNEIRNIRLYNVAVTSDRRELEMVVHLQGNTGGATANLSDLNLEGHARFRCASLTLDDIFQSFLIDSCKLLKIDCEGSEHEILLTARCLDRVQYLRGEFHINQHLRGQGYSIERLAQHCRRLIKPERVVFTSCQMFE
jgi:FkbM family methyltransferase